MSRLKAQIIKELLCLLRDPKSRVILIVPPLMQLLIFSYAATLEVSNVDMVLLNQDSGRWSQEVIAQISASSFIGSIASVADPEELRRAIDERKAVIALHFQADFSRNLSANKPAAIQILLDGRRANSAQIALSYMNTIISRVNEEIQPAITSVMPKAVIRNWFNPNLTYQWFIVPALVGTLAMTSSLIVCALSIARERELGTFDQLLVSPAKPLEIIIGKMVPALIVGSGLGCVMISAGVFQHPVYRFPVSCACQPGDVYSLGGWYWPDDFVHLQDPAAGHSRNVLNYCTADSALRICYTRGKYA